MTPQHASTAAHSLIADPEGHTTEEPPEERPTVNIRRVVLDWSAAIALVGGSMAWASLSADVRNNNHEIERLRLANEARAIADVRIAGEMATKADVQRVSDQVTALSAELRQSRIER